MKFCPNFLPFLEPKLEDFLSLTTYEILLAFFAFLEPKLEDLKLIEVGSPDVSWVNELHV